VALVRIDVSEERIASIIRVQWLITANVPNSLVLFALMIEAIL
jgi:hypothetical protein